MTDIKDMVKSYCDKTGQSDQELFAGAEFFGIDFIYNELLPKALKENKKIIWKDLDPYTEGIGAMSYSLEDI
jgi:hypothetical protein